MFVGNFAVELYYLRTKIVEFVGRNNHVQSAFVVKNDNKRVIPYVFYKRIDFVYLVFVRQKAERDLDFVIFHEVLGRGNRRCRERRESYGQSEA